jgi:ABC-2 type transport system ATP-binding protein
MSNVIRIEGLCKGFGKKTVLNNLSVEMNTGRVIGLLGENGVGKTTLLKLMAGFLRPDKGTVNYDDIERGKNRKEYISFLLEAECFYSWMKIKDAIQFYKDYFKDFNENTAIEYCNLFGLTLNDKIKILSKGEREKVSIILNLSRNTDIYLLDEPAGGFDPKFKKEIIHLILESMKDNKTIIISTHLLKDMENIFDDILILRKNTHVYMSCEDIRQKFEKSVEDYYLEVIRND